jgi:hypothetical protein
VRTSDASTKNGLGWTAAVTRLAAPDRSFSKAVIPGLHSAPRLLAGTGLVAFGHAVRRS